MKEFSREAEQIMIERFGKDAIIAMATTENATPYVRYVNAYYENGAFYVITHALSNKMKHIKDNPVVAIAGEWFTAHGKGVSLGYFGKRENCVIAEKLKKVFLELTYIFVVLELSNKNRGSPIVQSKCPTSFLIQCFVF